LPDRYCAVIKFLLVWWLVKSPSGKIYIYHFYSLVFPQNSHCHFVTFNKMADTKHVVRPFVLYCCHRVDHDWPAKGWRLTKWPPLDTWYGLLFVLLPLRWPRLTSKRMMVNKMAATRHVARPSFCTVATSLTTSPSQCSFSLLTDWKRNKRTIPNSACG